MQPNVSFNGVLARRGKITRAEPVAALYEQNKVHHVGAFTDLEDQLCSYVGDNGPSPDRYDALVWALTELAVKDEPALLTYYRERVRRRKAEPPDRVLAIVPAHLARADPNPPFF